MQPLLAFRPARTHPLSPTDQGGILHEVHKQGHEPEEDPIQKADRCLWCQNQRGDKVNVGLWGLVCSGPCGCGVALCPLAPTNTGELGLCSLLGTPPFPLPFPSFPPACPSCPWDGVCRAGLAARGSPGIFADGSASRSRRERSKVPYIVRQCVEEVEKRGIEEVGIYRISGVATDIQALKAVFDASECPGGACCSNGRVPRH